MAEIDWREFIHSDPEILLGKPVVKGTRISVDFILFMESYSYNTDPRWDYFINGETGRSLRMLPPMSIGPTQRR